MTKTRGEILDQVKQMITKERNDIHGEPENTFPLIAKDWTEYLHRAGLMPVSEKLQPHQVCELMAIFKDCRHQMNPTHADNRLDQIGYLALAVELQPGAAKVAPTDEGLLKIGKLIWMNEPYVLTNHRQCGNFVFQNWNSVLFEYNGKDWLKRSVFVHETFKPEAFVADGSYHVIRATGKLYNDHGELVATTNRSE